MSKRPQVGAVKRRLARRIGAVAAWQFYRRNLEALARRMRGPWWETRLLITPDGAAYRWPVRGRRLPQGRGDLGTRMLAGLDGQRGRHTVVIGCDIPGIRTAHIRAAFHRLGATDAVFGPATDGGYWLIGFSGRRRFHAPFARVRWSTADTLSDTLQNFRGRRVALAATLSDVDD